MRLTQQLASQIIGGVFNEKRNLNTLLTETFHSYPDLTYQQRAATQDISYGTVRFYGLINQVLQSLLHKPIEDQPIRHLLLVTLYQLIFTRAKAHAIVHSAVSLTDTLNKHYAKGFINAILRQFLRQKEVLIAQAKETDVGQYSHPQWWIKRMQAAYPQDWQRILLANNQHPPLTLRVNRQKIETDAYIDLLQTQGLTVRKLAPYAIQLDTPISVSLIPYFFDGYVSVQDWGAQFAAELLDIHVGMRVLDACAAPGGKTGHLLEIADVSLTALDKDTQRLLRVKDNLQRLNLHATVQCADASALSTWWDGQLFDRILADVPCSASGVVRRHPDIKWLRRPEDIDKFATQQQTMLDQLWDCLDKNGKLLYTTCSIFPEENIAQVQAFILRHPDAIHLAATQLKATHQYATLNHNGQLLPNQEHDGFYYALFQKI